MKAGIPQLKYLYQPTSTRESHRYRPFISPHPSLVYLAVFGAYITSVVIFLKSSLCPDLLEVVAYNSFAFSGRSGAVPNLGALRSSRTD